ARRDRRRNGRGTAARQDGEACRRRRSLRGRVSEVLLAGTVGGRPAHRALSPARERRTHIDRDHAWHTGIASRLAEADGKLILATSHRIVDLTDPSAEADAVRWWEELTGSGGEGMVVKPFEFVAKGRKGLVQPA